MSQMCKNEGKMMSGGMQDTTTYVNPVFNDFGGPKFLLSGFENAAKIN